jgi:crotonobetainyl-CoA:carnitine CoA-transferase CaiB-like acyl-CoA transferase
MKPRGEDRDEDCNATKPEVRAASAGADAMTKGGPLTGVRVLDAASLLAGPTSATLLAEYGAEVIKIEQPGGGDTMRRYPPFHDDTSLLWKVIARDRKSVTLNLRTPGGREVFRKLVAECDVVTLNNRPETLVKWGIDFDDLVKVNPRLILLHVSAYGRTGPYANRPGFARVAEAFAGLTHRTGFAGEEPAQSGYPMLGDGVTGLYGAFAIMLALRQRDRTRQPQLIDLGLYETFLRLIEDQIPAYGADGTVMSRIGNSNPLICPNGLFPTRDGRFVSIPASTEPLWRRLVGLLGDDSLLAYDSNPVRIRHREMIEGKVAAWTKSHDFRDLIQICADAGIACGPVYSVEDIVNDPHIRARGSVIEVEDEDCGKVLIAAPAGRFSGFEAQIGKLGPGLGAHTDQVLGDLLGFDADRIAALRASGDI